MNRDPETPRPLPLWTVVAYLALIIVATVLLYVSMMAPVWSLPDSTSAVEKAQLANDALKSSLAAGGGLTGIGLALLAFRRQRENERTTREQHALELRRLNQSDEQARQQQITNLRLQAVEQLAHDNPTVRIGGLHNLELLANQNPELRQLVIDEYCAYLRMPFTLPDLYNVDYDDPEFQVRRTVQRILVRHLERGDQYWEHKIVPLSGAFLHHMQFRDCELHRPTFVNCIFTGDTIFEDTTLHTGKFHMATFHGPLAISRTEFHESTGFNETTMIDETTLRDSVFRGTVRWERSTMHKKLDCSETEFRDVRFTDTRWMAGGTFRSCGFSGSTVWDGSRSDSDLAFENGSAEPLS
ncbi:pentapeptide repeat-containing protein [Salininema proteolyticum]|uniref:Pentapeptide repeat-containing protein n=1 Tax=Salininema proteolyticum TaxID=1607685 RepID=A0ABV8TZ32_9ACTN